MVDGAQDLVGGGRGALAIFHDSSRVSNGEEDGAMEVIGERREKHAR